jgi:hypothetical protein
MPTADGTATTDGPLQFDRVVHADPPSDADRSAPGVRCSACGATMTEEYHTVDGAPACPTCRDAIERQAAPVREWPLVGRAALPGLGAAIVGAAVYYGVIAITDYEIGLVAILCGWMVGWAVRKGARGRGGRRLQVLALALTYFSIALAYLPLAMKGGQESFEKTAAAGADSSRAAAVTGDSVRAEAIAGAAPVDPAPVTTSERSTTATAATDSAVAPKSAGGVAFAFGALLLFTLALPVLSVFGSMPGGILSAIIIGIGLRQAWTMTGAPELKIRGPLRVGGAAPDAAA